MSCRHERRRHVWPLCRGGKKRLVTATISGAGTMADTVQGSIGAPQVDGVCAPGFEGGPRRFPGKLPQPRRSGRQRVHHASRRNRRRSVGGRSTTQDRRAVAARHGVHRVFVHQGRDRAVRAHAGRTGQARPVRRCRDAVAGISPLAARRAPRWPTCWRIPRRCRICAMRCARAAMPTGTTWLHAWRAEPAWWAPGTRQGYHGVTYAWTVGPDGAPGGRGANERVLQARNRRSAGPGFSYRAAGERRTSRGADDCGRPVRGEFPVQVHPGYGAARQPAAAFPDQQWRGGFQFA